jgi:hypothetical protein
VIITETAYKPTHTRQLFNPYLLIDFLQISPIALSLKVKILFANFQCFSSAIAEKLGPLKTQSPLIPDFLLPKMNIRGLFSVGTFEYLMTGNDQRLIRLSSSLFIYLFDASFERITFSVLV